MENPDVAPFLGGRGMYKIHNPEEAQIQKRSRHLFSWDRRKKC